jgi:casein kinase II subunit alpha
MSVAGRIPPRYPTQTISPVYAFINEYLLPDGDKAISDYSVDFGDIDRYQLISPIGTGKYSIVFLGRYDRNLCAIKILKDISFAKIRRELFILGRISSVPHVVHVIDVNLDPLTQTTSIVTNYIAADNPRTLYPRLSLRDMAFYVYCLLFTLDQCHSRGVMHRDIKPGNVCIDHASRKLCVIDWGLSDLYYPRTQYSVRVSTLRYKAPELLLGYHFYDYGIDVWGAGCILAEMLFGFGFISGQTPEEVIGGIARLWGCDAVHAYCGKYGIALPEEFRGRVAAAAHGGWDDAIALMRPAMRDRDAVDLAKRLLTVDHAERITARDALRHPFFARYLR